MYISPSNLLIWLICYPFAFYLMVDSTTDFTFRRPQKLLSLFQRSWQEYEGHIAWLLLARFLTGFLLILLFSQYWLQALLICLLLLLEILAGQLYLPKMKRD